MKSGAIVAIESMTGCAFTSTGAVHGSPRSSATSETRANHRVSVGSSACVTTSGTSTSCARSTRRHRAHALRRPMRKVHVVVLALKHRADHVARPLAHLLVDASDVFAEKADAEHDAADQEELEDVAVP